MRFPFGGGPEPDDRTPRILLLGRPLPPPRPRPYLLHITLFLLTILTTLVVGARLQYNFELGLVSFPADEEFFPIGWALMEPKRLLLGVPFAATLMSFLLAHEMGHFVYAMRYGVQATLPYFIPAPTPIGTFGAFIQIRSPFETRQSLFDIGIGGPVAGFLVALPMMVAGLAMSKPLNPSIDPELMRLGHPLIFHLGDWLAGMMRGDQVPLDLLHLHPVALAAWIGMLATALNLMPGGQLDGGHIVYAVFPGAHGLVTRVLALAMLPLAYFYWSGWIFWMVFLSLMTRHSYVPEYPAMPPSRRMWAWVAFVLFVVTVTPAPFPGSGLRELLEYAWMVR